MDQKAFREVAALIAIASLCGFIQTFWILFVPSVDDYSLLWGQPNSDRLIAVHTESGRYIGAWLIKAFSVLTGGFWVGAPATHLLVVFTFATLSTVFVSTLPVRFNFTERLAAVLLATLTTYKLDVIRFELNAFLTFGMLLGCIAFFVCWRQVVEHRRLIWLVGCVLGLFFAIGSYQTSVYLIIVFLITFAGFSATPLLRQIWLAGAAGFAGLGLYLLGLLVSPAPRAAGRLGLSLGDWPTQYAQVSKRIFIDAEPIFPIWVKLALLIALIASAAVFLFQKLSGPKPSQGPSPWVKAAALIGLFVTAAGVGSFAYHQFSWVAPRLLLQADLTWAALLLFALSFAPGLRHALCAVAFAASVLLTIVGGSFLHDGYVLAQRANNLASQIIAEARAQGALSDARPIAIIGMVTPRSVGRFERTYYNMNGHGLSANWSVAPMLSGFAGRSLGGVSREARETAVSACAQAAPTPPERMTTHKIVETEFGYVICLETALRS